MVGEPVTWDGLAELDFRRTVGAQSKERKGSNFAIWQPWLYIVPRSYRRPVGGDEEGAVVLCSYDEVVAVGPRVAARDGVGEVGQHARRLPRLHVLRGGGQGTMAAAAPALK